MNRVVYFYYQSSKKMEKVDSGFFRNAIRVAADQIVKIREKSEAANVMEKVIGSDGRVSFKNNEYVQTSSVEEINQQDDIIVENAKTIIENGMSYTELVKSFQMLLAGIPARREVAGISKVDKKENYNRLEKMHRETLRVLIEHETDLSSTDNPA